MISTRPSRWYVRPRKNDRGSAEDSTADRVQPLGIGRFLSLGATDGGGLYVRRNVQARSGEDGAVKRSTAVGHLVDMAEMGTEGVQRRESGMGWPVEELWVTDDLLGLSDTMDAATVVLALDVPAEELPWLALYPAGERVGTELGLDKRPMSWCYRLIAWPVWNHQHRRLARFWSARDGLEKVVVAALGTRRFGQSSVVEPSVASSPSSCTRSLPCRAITSAR